MRCASDIRKFNGPRMADYQKSDRKPAGLPLRLKELWTFACFPVSQQRGFYFPPPANKDRAVNSIEIKDFMILWTYSQWRQDLVVIPPFSPEREFFECLSISIHRILTHSNFSVLQNITSEVIICMFPDYKQRKTDGMFPVGFSSLIFQWVCCSCALLTLVG